MSFIAAILFNEDVSELANQIAYPVHSWGTDSQVIMRSIKVLDTETVIELAFDGQIISGTPKSLRLLSDSTSAYSVTSGKTAKIILILRGVSATSAIAIGESATADVAIVTTKHTTASVTTNEYSTVVIDSIAATKFVTINPTTASRICSVVSAIAIES